MRLSLFCRKKKSKFFVLVHNAKFFASLKNSLIFMNASKFSCLDVMSHIQATGMNLYWKPGKRSELRKSERRKPKRTPKTMQTITTSKRFIKAIRTLKSELSQRRKELITTTKITTSKRTSKVIKTTFDVVIILNAIGKIRTPKV